jgi:hypothetical protein
MTIELPLSGETFEAELVQDEHGVLWVAEPSAAAGVRLGHQSLEAVLKIGWRILRLSPEEQQQLDAHGFQSMSGRPPSGPEDEARNGGTDL